MEGLDCIAYEATNRIFIPWNCSSQLNALCYIDEPIGVQSYIVHKRVTLRQLICVTDSTSVDVSACEFDDGVWAGSRELGGCYNLIGLVAQRVIKTNLTHYLASTFVLFNLLFRPTGTPRWAGARPEAWAPAWQR